MPRGATQRRVLGVRRSYSSEDEPEPRLSEVAGPNQDQGPVEPVDVQLRTGRGLWWSVGLSVLGSAAAVTAAGCFCALTYPILKELRSERVRGQDGTEQRILGFWSILVLSVVLGCICCVFSWTLTHIDSRQRSGVIVPSLEQDKYRDAAVHESYLGHGVAVLNGIMGFFTVIWNLT